FYVIQGRESSRKCPNSRAGGAGATPLVVTFNSDATPAAVQALLRAVTFSNVSGNPSQASRSVSLVLLRPDGISVAATASVSVGLLRVSRFQQGWDHGYGLYTSAADTELNAAKSNVSLTIGHSSNYAIWMDAPADGAATEAAQALLRFSNLAGDELGRIPTNAVIVSAELRLTISPDISNSPGDGSPLYRMLVSWDPNSITWNDAGDGSGGFQLNDVHARSSYDSFLGLASGGGDTSTGTISLGVTADVEAWVNGGEPNYGWLMPGWLPPAAAQPRTDGTAFAACEWPHDAAQRPLLQVLWLPAGAAVAGFRQGVDGYSGAQDTRVREGNPKTTYATATGIYDDGDASDVSQMLIWFDDAVGTGPGQVPPGARIDAARLEVSSSVTDAHGDGGQFFRLLQPWQDSTSTWNWWGDGIQADDLEAASTPSAAVGSPDLAPNAQAAYHSFDLTADVQSWVHGSTTNYGWAILPWPNGSDAWGIASAEAASERDRPRLRVFYTVPAAGDIVLFPPIQTPTQVYVPFASIVGTRCTVQRASALDGAWITLGSAIVGQDGVATFTDSSPLPQAAFYRVTFP
ncbi:MAG TPA: DNRLRE domain-containing protein, partial [Verrucomicrobiota bacterium]|nr:DNRLRE domain-containing protein [Verrucomicrobiota bacterium]HQL80023.1 DNRLRE domain-containing protein [Verrucomicrobiota bacterium]